MDRLTFASNIISSLAWPTSALVLGLMFRKKFIELIPSIRKFKAGPLEAEFEIAAKDIRVTAAAVRETIATKAREGDRHDQQDPDQTVVENFLTARSDPTGMILASWSKVEAELFRIGRQLGDITSTSPDISTAYNLVMSAHILPPETARLVQDLRDLRNKVSHAKVSATPDAAQDYVIAADRVIYLIHNYRKNLPNYSRPSE